MVDRHRLPASLPGSPLACDLLAEFDSHSVEDAADRQRRSLLACRRGRSDLFDRAHRRTSFPRRQPAVFAMACTRGPAPAFKGDRRPHRRRIVLVDRPGHIASFRAGHRGCILQAGRRADRRRPADAASRHEDRQLCLAGRLARAGTTGPVFRGLRPRRRQYLKLLERAGKAAASYLCRFEQR